jgi:ABC transporter, permease protein
MGKACKEVPAMSKKKSGMQIYTKQDKAILYCGYALLALFLIAIIVPMVYIVIASFMDPVTLQNKGISFDFSKWSLDAYERVISDKQIWVGFKTLFFIRLYLPSFPLP